MVTKPASLKVIRKHQDIILLVFAALLIIFSGLSFLFFAKSQQAAPISPSESYNQINNIDSHSTNSSTEQINSLSHSKPSSIHIPSIHVETNIISVGKNADGTMEMPVKENTNKAAWYRNSATPGQLGASVVAGHVDYGGSGPAVFYRLGELKPGDEIKVQRKDGTAANFVTTDIRTFKKDNFPTKLVYGSTSQPTLRLITCGGEFDKSINDYESNTIVFAELKENQAISHNNKSQVNSSSVGITKIDAFYEGVIQLNTD